MSLTIKRLIGIFAISVIAGAAGAMDNSFKKPPLDQLKKTLSKMQFKVTQKDGTEPPFQNEYWDNKEDGIYVDIVSGEALFSSKDKFKSGTGWPSFTQPINKDNIVEKSDRSVFMVRTEVRSKLGDSHLGHVFDDGPKPTGKRYCMNSAALRFIKAKDLKDEGFPEYSSLFALNSTEAKNDGKQSATKESVAIFAGGCFWCMEPPFEKLAGVKAVVSGYIGGKTENPSYKEVSSGGSGHVEAVKITYDASAVSYEKLLSVFWRNINPTDNSGQFVDRGEQYRPAIFVENDEERRQAEESKQQLQQSKRFAEKKISTEILTASKFFPAEEYHQDYYKKNPIRYKYYRYQSGRDSFLKKYWKK